MAIRPESRQRAEKMALLRVDQVMELINPMISYRASDVMEISKRADALREEIRQFFINYANETDDGDHLKYVVGISKIIGDIHQFAIDSLNRVDIGIPANKPLFSLSHEDLDYIFKK